MFDAKYRGPCAGGCDGIEPGDEVGYEDGALMHADCENAAGLREDAPRRPEVVCTVCFMVKPCECDDEA